MQEQTILADRGILVSTTRFVTPLGTYAMAQISSVRMAADPNWPLTVLASLALGLMFGFCGVASMVSNPNGPGIGFMIGCVGAVFVGWAVYTQSNRKFYVVLRTSAGEAPALSDKNMAWIQHVSNAINHAIISRG